MDIWVSFFRNHVSSPSVSEEYCKFFPSFFKQKIVERKTKMFKWKNPFLTFCSLVRISKMKNQLNMRILIVIRGVSRRRRWFFRKNPAAAADDWKNFKIF